MPDENVSRVPFGPHAEDRHRHLLPARAAVRDVQIAVAIEDRIVDLMKTGGEGRGDLHGGGVPVGCRHAHRHQSGRGEARRDDHVQAGRRRERHAGALVPNVNGRELIAINGEIGTVNGDAAAVNRARRVYGLQSQGSTDKSDTTQTHFQP